MEKIFNTNGNEKKHDVAILDSNKIDFKINIINDEEEDYIIISQPKKETPHL